MAKPTPSGHCATAEPTPAKEHLAPLTDAALSAACSRYLELRSQCEAISQEYDQLAQKLAQLNQAIAHHLGPLEHPLVLNHQGMLLVINVAEGVLKPGLVTATVTEAWGAADVLDIASPDFSGLEPCNECGSPLMQDWKGKRRCEVCLHVQEVA